MASNDPRIDPPPAIAQRVRDAACVLVWRATDVNLSLGHERMIQAAAREALTVAKERFADVDFGEESDVIDALIHELSDGNQQATQSSGDNRGSAAQKSNPQSSTPLLKARLP